MRNVEIKAKVRNLAQLIENARKISDTPREIIKQHDTFFNSKFGRLKLREFEVSRSFFFLPAGGGSVLSGIIRGPFKLF